MPFCSLQAWAVPLTFSTMKLKLGITILLFSSLLALNALANPYLPKSGERPVPLRVATSAVTGGFIHLYSALDYGILEKYGFKPAEKVPVLIG